MIKVPRTALHYGKAQTIAWILFTLLSCHSAPHPDEGEHVQTLLPTDSTYIQVSVLREQTFHHELISNGTISPVRRADLRFEAPDIVEEIYVKNGQRVSKGQKIAALSRFKLQNTLAQASDNLAKSQLELQDVLISQGYTLRDSLHIPGNVMQIVRIKSNYEQNNILYELARYNLDHAVIYAPFDGVVANLFSRPYNLSSPTEPFCTIVDTRQLEADFKILESELAPLTQADMVKKRISSRG